MTIIRKIGIAIRTTATTPTYVAASASVVSATNRDRASTSATRQQHTNNTGSGVKTISTPNKSHVQTLSTITIPQSNCRCVSVCLTGMSLRKTSRYTDHFSCKISGPRKAIGRACVSVCRTGHTEMTRVTQAFGLLVHLDHIYIKFEIILIGQRSPSRDEKCFFFGHKCTLGGAMYILSPQTSVISYANLSLNIACRLHMFREMQLRCCSPSRS